MKINKVILSINFHNINYLLQVELNNDNFTNFNTKLNIKIIK